MACMPSTLILWQVTRRLVFML